MLIDLGLENVIVGRHGWDRELDASLPVVGDQTGVDYEALARVRPTHVLIQQTATETPQLLFDLASKRGWAVVSLPLLALDDIPRAVDTLHREFASIDGVGDRAAAIVERMDAAWRPRPELNARAGRTLCVYWTSPIGVAGPGSFHHDLLKRMGVEALPVSGAPFITLDLEDLRRMNPDSIIFLSTDITDENLPAIVDDWRRLGLSALESGRVAALSDPRFLTPSTAMIDLADAIAAAAAEWAPASQSETEISQ